MSNFPTQPKTTPVMAAPQKHAAPQSKPAVPPTPSHDAIARQAYDLYVKKGRQQGQCKQNWQQAERDLQNKGQATGDGQERDCKHTPTPHPGSIAASK